MFCVSRFIRCLLERYWRSIVPEIIEREFTPVELFFQALSSSDPPLIGSVEVSAWRSVSRAEAERIGWGDGDENAQMMGTVRKLGPEDVLKLLRERWRLGGRQSLVGWIMMKGPWSEDSTEVLSMTILSARYGSLS
ncbi:hypothetical protein B0T21DRAFT_448550 [Apiosordaria backusii]|uniref:Uncharacterized protein n=1 Tax=Apiosordaria backusii TaxID=314023 RepID=A0AA40ELX1_9PEZI|nr:hypothetical protein B0T21DRAFT_448550 [Apiosordaria backusii]